MLTTGLVFSTACQRSAASTALPANTPIPINTHIPLVTATATATSMPEPEIPTPTLERQAEIIREKIKIPAKPPEATPEALQFEAPPPSPVLVAAWRPPLYQVPLALTSFDHFYFIKPFAVDEDSRPVEDYRYGGFLFEDVVHTGMDIRLPVNTPIIAAGPGEVVWAGYGLQAGRYDPGDPYGNAVMIRHNFGYKGQRLYTAYAHLNRVDVERGQQVEAGEQLGLSGATGRATGPHLHFEVRLDLNGFFATRNPELWLVPPQGWGVLAGKVMNTGGRNIQGQRVIVQPLEGEKFWRANSYHGGYINPDDYYQENLVISDLPAGRYQIVINYLSRIYRQEIEIYPGMVTYFSFRGRSGFTSEAPPLPGGDFNPPQTP